MLSQSLSRLSSGLRINSAKDDAAGLAITGRMTAQIRGLNQAVRNANDGISLAQTAEGALTESTNILQRIRELAVQSINDTNSAGDRSNLQKEVVALRAEVDRISENIQFNGKNLLDGTFSDQVFQIGAVSGQTIELSIEDAGSDQMGGNLVNTINANGTLSQALAATSTFSNYSNVTDSEDLTVVGEQGTSSVNITANMTAKDIAAAINLQTSATNVEALANTYAKLTNFKCAGVVSFRLYGSTDVAIEASVGASSDLSTLAAAINAATAAGITATLNSDSTAITLYNSEGYNIGVQDMVMNYNNHTTATGTVSFQGLQADGITASGGAQTVSVGSTATLVSTGTLSDASAACNSYTNIKEADSANTEDLTIVGWRGTSTVNIANNWSAKQIADAIDATESSSGVYANAQSYAKLANFNSSGGGVSFTLHGSTYVNIDVTIGATGDLTGLANEINGNSATTGITASLNNAKTTVTLYNGEGYNIGVQDFQYKDITTTNAAYTAYTVSFSGMIASNFAVDDSGALTGNVSSATLYGSAGVTSANDSAMVGGQVIFTSSTSQFTVTSASTGGIMTNTTTNSSLKAQGTNDSSMVGGNVLFYSTTADRFSVQGEAAGKIFDSTAFQTSDTSQLTIAEIDISSQSGAAASLSAIDGALDYIADIRADLGSFQNRLTSTISNLQNVSENMSASRSRIMDADFAAETARLTQQQILVQAGTAMLAQANQLPQQVLSLLS